MTARIAHIRNVVAPELDLRTHDMAPGVSITEAIGEAGWHLAPGTFLLRRDLIGQDIDIDWAHVKHADVFTRRSEWDALPLNDNELAVLVTLPLGGGGGASQILQIVAEIALLAVAIVFAPELAATLGVAALTGLTAAQATAIAAGAIMVGGSLILQAVLPKPSQKSPTNTNSPTYNIGAQSNQARLTAAVPEWFGLYNMFPDLRAQPYFDFVDNEQTLYELFCIGKGAYRISQLRIGTNVFAQIDDDGNLQPTGSYPNITWEIAGPGETLTLFPDNVVTSTEVSNIELLGTNQDNYAPTPWYVANPPDTFSNVVCIDVSLPGGLYHQTSSGNLDRAEVAFEFWAQPIDDYGNVSGDPFVILDTDLWLATMDPQQITYRCTVPNGRYQVRGERTNSKGTSTSVSDTLLWLALRAYLPSFEAYNDCTMLAIKSSATSQSLSGSSTDQFNVVATRMLSTPVEIDGVWQWSAEKQPTRSIGAAAYYILTASNCAGLDPSVVDGNWLLQKEALWQSRGDTFDGGFDTQQSLWDMLNSCLNVGRTQALPGPLIGFSRDEQKTLYRCAFSPRTMIKDSFTINYVFYNSTTSVDGAYVSYMDEVNWTQTSILVTLPGSTLTEQTAPQITAFGMVSRDQVWREWTYKLAASVYRRQFPQFDTELDGRVCQRGDLVKVSHLLPKWGASADVVALQTYDAGDILTLSEPWLLDSEESPIIMVTTPDGYLAGPATVNILDDGSTSRRAVVQLTEALLPDQGIYAGEPIANWGIWGDALRGLQRERPKAMLGSADEVPLDALVVSMTPSGNSQATVACVIDVPAVYTADEGEEPERINPPVPPAQEDLQITSLDIRETINPTDMEGNTVLCTVTVGGAPDATSFQYRKRFENSGAWSNVITGASRTFQFVSIEGELQLQVLAVGSSAMGHWFEHDFDCDGHVDIYNPSFDFSRRANSGNIVFFYAAWGP